jgi:hypothetical protein
MAIDRTQVQKQLTAIRNQHAADWSIRYPNYQHQKDRPINRPRLICRISDMTHANNEVTVHARISNIGSGASYHTKIKFLYAVLAPILQIPGGPSAPPTPVHEQLKVITSEKIAVHPGVERDIVFTVPQQWVINVWQAAVLCYDPVTDPLPMATWYQHLLPLDNLLAGATNPPQSPPLPHWQEFDSPNATQPRTANPTWYGRSNNPSALQLIGGVQLPGQRYFAPGNSATVSELRQTVTLAQHASLIAQGNMLLRLTGWVRSFDQSPTDRTQIILECLANDDTVLAELDLGQNTNTDDWRLLSGTLIVPSGTTQARVRLRSTRRAGTNNDGYFDNITLTPAHRQIATASRWLFG